MKAHLQFLAIAMLFHATSSIAMPMLSSDGSLLTGVDVGDTLYNVMFGNGVAGDVYAGITFDDARRSEATAVTFAIVNALNLIGDVGPQDISGCDDSSFCILFNPLTSFKFSEGPVAYRANPYIANTDATRWAAGSDTTVTDNFNSAGISTTLVTYERAESPVPHRQPSPYLVSVLLALGSAAGNDKPTAKPSSPAVVQRHQRRR